MNLQERFELEKEEGKELLSAPRLPSKLEGKTKIEIESQIEAEIDRAVEDRAILKE